MACCDPPFKSLPPENIDWFCHRCACLINCLARVSDTLGIPHLDRFDELFEDLAEEEAALATAVSSTTVFWVNFSMRERESSVCNHTIRTNCYVLLFPLGVVYSTLTDPPLLKELVIPVDSLDYHINQSQSNHTSV